MRLLSRVGTVTVYSMVFLLLSAIPGTAEGDVCVAVNGDVKVEQGNSLGMPSNDGVAVAVNGSVAYVRDGVDNLAVAVNGSSATAWLGDDGRAIAVNDSNAGASGWEPSSVTGNAAVAVNDSIAFAGAGSDNSAVAVNSSEAYADGGSDNTANAVNDSLAYATGGMETLPLLSTTALLAYSAMTQPPVRSAKKSPGLLETAWSTAVREFERGCVSVDASTPILRMRVLAASRGEPSGLRSVARGLLVNTGPRQRSYFRTAPVDRIGTTE